MPDSSDSPWTVYVLTSQALAATYVGVALDVDRRVRQHNGQLPGGARFTRAGRPWILSARYGPFPTRGEAQQAEYHLKRLTGRARLEWDGALGAEPE